MKNRAGNGCGTSHISKKYMIRIPELPDNFHIETIKQKLILIRVPINAHYILAPPQLTTVSDPLLY